MIGKRKTTTLLLVLFFSAVSNAISTGFSYFDNTTENQMSQVPIGSWAYNTQSIGAQLATDLSVFADNHISQNNNSPFLDVYSQSGNLSNVTATFENISFYDYIWDVTGIGTGSAYSTLGYISLIDRSEDTSNNLIHPTLTEYTTSPTYNQYNFFTSSDAMNSNTNTNYSLRLNYGVTIQTDTTISNINQISFYAARGMTSPRDTFTMASNRTFVVSVSTNGTNWTVLGTETPPVAATSNFNYAFYTYTIPSNLQGQNLYLRIQYNGEGTKQGKVKEYARLVIDELVITTN